MLRNFVNKLHSVENRNTITCFLRYKKTVALTEEYEIEDTEEVIDTTEEDKEKEDLIQKKRNKSRLSSQHYNILHEKVPYPKPLLDFQQTVKYQRKIYGVYGESSGVDPKICWPSAEDVANIKEYEQVKYPFTIKQIMEENTSKKKEFEDQRNQRQSEIVKKFAKLEQMKKELTAKLAKKEAEARASKERKDRLVEEVRRHFGFKIDPRDERFKEMLEKKEKEEKKATKEAKRKVKEAKFIAKIQEINEDKTSTESKNDEKTQTIENKTKPE